MGLFTKFDYVSVNVTDWARAKKFYGETLGLPTGAFISDEVGWMQFGTEGSAQLAISLWRGPEAFPRGEGGATIIFAVDDAHKAVEELRRRGVRCEDVIAIPEMVTYATFYDPDGNRLQVAGPPPRKSAEPPPFR
jgi:predicted enzyme related to lactoylglutathione lyase